MLKLNNFKKMQQLKKLETKQMQLKMQKS